MSFISKPGVGHPPLRRNELGLRIRAFPFNEQVDEFLAAHERIFVVEQNRDGQLKMLLLNESMATREQLISVLHYSGFPLGCDSVITQIQAAMPAKGAAA